MASGDLILSVESTAMHPGTDDKMDLGESAIQFKDLYLDGLAYIDGFGEDTDFGDFDVHSVDGLYGFDDLVFVDLGTDGRIIISADGSGTPFSTPDIDITGTTYFDDDSGFLLDKKIMFGDTGVYIFSDDDGRLDLTADTSIDLNGNVALGSASTSTLTCTGRLILRTLVTEPIWTRPAGSTNEIAYYSGRLYYCIDGSIPEWKRLAIDIIPSPSPSISPSLSASLSRSSSYSPSPSYSPSKSPSLSPSKSPSISPSPSYSPSRSESLSPSLSPSKSPSASESKSPSLSPSVSESMSPSLSPSASESLSPSISPSVSPSPSTPP